MINAEALWRKGEGALRCSRADVYNNRPHGIRRLTGDGAGRLTEVVVTCGEVVQRIVD